MLIGALQHCAMTERSLRDSAIHYYTVVWDYFKYLFRTHDNSKQYIIVQSAMVKNSDSRVPEICLMSADSG